MKKYFLNKTIASLSILFLGLGILSAQPLPPPGFPSGPLPPSQTPPPPSGTLPPPAPINNMSPATPPPPSAVPPGWGSPGILVNPPSDDWMNQGTLNVMATGYDTESVLVQIPLTVSYYFNGANYDVTVVNAWSPFTQTWNMGVDIPASQTSFYFNGFNYNFTVSLPSGTFYFNL